MCYSFQISWSSKKNLTPKVEDQKRLVQAYVYGMHGRGSQASAPASDAARRGRVAADRASVPRCAASCHVAIPESGRRGWNRHRHGRNRRQLGPYRPVSAESAGIGRNGRSGRNSKKRKKKKKGAKLTVWLNLNTQTLSAPHTSSKTPKHPLSLRPSSLFSVFWALCECCVHTALLQTLVSILWIIFNLWTSCFSYYLLLLLNLVFVYIMWKSKSMLSNILNIYCKNIFNNFLIVESCHTRTHLFQKLPSPAPAPAPKSQNAPVLHRSWPKVDE